MPAERTRSSKRGDRQRREPTSNSPDDPCLILPPVQTISFAPTVTPGTFFDPPEPVEPPPESLLFPPSPDAPLTPSRRGGHTKKKPENHIPRPPNAFILFRSSFIKNQHVSSDVETNHSTLSKIIGLTWQNLPHDEKQIWHTRAKLALQEHKKKFPEYAFRPSQPKGAKAPEKRKVREVGPKDLKRCAKIAELLVEGKRGAELDAAIAEFDRSHIPEIVTRFEAPITARTYRRSSSAPVVDAGHAKPKTRKARATSTQPPEPSTPDVSLDPFWSRAMDSDVDTSSNYFLSMPSSPCEPSAEYSLPETNPVFDLDAFNFSAATPTPMPEPVDPLSPHIEQQVVYDPFVDFTRAPATADASSTDDVFAPNLNLSINTNFYNTPADPYSDSPSPASSMPSTPQGSQDMSFSLVYGADAGVPSSVTDYSSSVLDYGSSYNYFPSIPTYSETIAPTYAATHRTTAADSHYYPTAKPDFQYFEKPGMAAYEDGSAQTFVPSYTM